MKAHAAAKPVPQKRAPRAKSAKRNGSAKPARSSRSGRPIPQPALLHAARTIPTPPIFNDVPDEMPFSTNDQ
jgi:hypothetical protein